MVIFKSKAELSAVFCDMLSITLQLQPQDREAALGAMAELVNTGYAKQCYKGGRYYRSIYVGIGDNNESLVLVQAEPKQPHMAFLRVEFNPAKSSPAEVRLQLDKVIPNGGYSRLFQQGTCTRVDVAVDVNFAAIENLLFWIPRLKVSRAYAKGSKAESLVYGSATSDKIVRVYDKAKQLKKANVKTPFKSAIPYHSVTRIEVQLTHRFPAKDLAGLKNPFSDITISNPSKTVFNGDQDRLFLLACEAFGLLRALAALRNGKAVYLEKLKTAAVKWWNPTKLWGQWQGVANSIMNPPPWGVASAPLPAMPLGVAASTGLNLCQ